MLTQSNSAPLTIGKLLGLTLDMYGTHIGVFLRTVAIPYLPLALLSFFFARDSISVTLFSLVIFPFGALVSLAIIVHCVDSLHGRPLTVTAALGRGLRRLPANIVMVLVASAVYVGLTIILATPIWFGLLNTDISTDILFGEIRDLFTVPPDPIDIEVIMNVLDEVLWGGLGICFFGVLILVAMFYLSSRWIVAETALMVEGTGPLESLRRSWNLSRDFVLRSVGYLLILSIATGLVGGLISVVVSFGLAFVFTGLDHSLQAGLQGAVSTLLSIFFIPFQVTAVVLYYFDLRVRKEKVDFGFVQE